jgi:AAA domain-containing protein
MLRSHNVFLSSFWLFLFEPPIQSAVNFVFEFFTRPWTRTMAPSESQTTVFPAYIAVKCDVSLPDAPSGPDTTPFTTTIGCGSIASATYAPQSSTALFSLANEPNHISYICLKLTVHDKSTYSSTTPLIHEICLYLNAAVLTGGSCADLPKEATERIGDGRCNQITPDAWKTKIFVHRLGASDINQALSQTLGIHLSTLKEWFEAAKHTVWLLSLEYNSKSLNAVLKLPTGSISRWSEDFLLINDQVKSGNGTIYILIQAQSLESSFLPFLSSISRQFSRPGSNMPNMGFTDEETYEILPYPYNLIRWGGENSIPVDLQIRYAEMIGNIAPRPVFFGWEEYDTVVRYSLAQEIRKIESKTNSKLFQAQIRFCSFKRGRGQGFVIFIERSLDQRQEVKLEEDDNIRIILRKDEDCDKTEGKKITFRGDLMITARICKSGKFANFSYDAAILTGEHKIDRMSKGVDYVLSGYPILRKNIMKLEDLTHSTHSRLKLKAMLPIPVSMHIQPPIESLARQVQSFHCMTEQKIGKFLTFSGENSYLNLLATVTAASARNVTAQLNAAALVLNEPQQLVLSSLHKMRNGVLLIQGPAGVGKSFVARKVIPIVSATLESSRNNSPILFVTPSNKLADDMARCLWNDFGNMPDRRKLRLIRLHGINTEKGIAENIYRQSLPKTDNEELATNIQAEESPGEAGEGGEGMRSDVLRSWTGLKYKEADDRRVQFIEASLG